MIYIYNLDKNTWAIYMPHEVNNEFFSPSSTAAEEGKIKGINYIPYFGDFWELEFPLDKLDKLYSDFEVLEKNLDEITKVVPLPKEIGRFDLYYREGYVGFFKGGEEEFKKYFPEVSDEKIKSMVDYGNVVDNPDNFIKKFTKEDMLLIIGLIKKKILEAKEKGETLTFIGD